MKEKENYGSPFPPHAMKLREAGYWPIPIPPSSKGPRVKEWQKPKEHQWGRMTDNTGAGVLCGIEGPNSFIAVDIDCPTEGISEKLTAFLDPAGVCPTRVGKAPKILLVFRMTAKYPDYPKFEKIKSAIYTDKQGADNAIEILGTGQQFVAYGIHPDTKKPYVWNKPLESWKVEELPELAPEKLLELNALFNQLMKAGDFTFKSDSKGFEKFARKLDGKAGKLPLNAPDKPNKAPIATAAADPLEEESAKNELSQLLEKYVALNKKADLAPWDDYEQWRNMGLILHFEGRGKEWAFNLWDGYSRLSPLYSKEQGGKSGREKCSYHWGKMKDDPNKENLTKASLIKWIKDLETLQAPTVLDEAKIAELDAIADKAVGLNSQIKAYLLKAFQTRARSDFEAVKRDLAKTLGISIKLLESIYDEAFPKVDTDKVEEDFNDVEPWEAPVKITDLWKEIADNLSRFIYFEDREQDPKICALWVLSTWVKESLDYFPILMITAPTAGCGKTSLLEVLEQLVYKPVLSSFMSYPVTRDLVDEYHPTLLLDETDTFLKEDKQALTLLNSGVRREGKVYVNEPGEGAGKKWKRRKCFTYGPKAICGISSNSIAYTLTDRSIVISLQRTPPGKKTDDYTKHRIEKPIWHVIRRKCERFRLDYGKRILDIIPNDVEGVLNRDRQKWEILLLIGYLIAEENGEHREGWIKYFESIARNRTAKSRKENLSENDRLLLAIKEKIDNEEVFPADDIKTETLLSALNTDPELGYGDGKNQLTGPKLARVLNGYNVRAKKYTTRENHNRSYYDRRELEAVFANYLFYVTQLPGEAR